MAANSVEEVDYTVVGAGWFGVCTARSILALNPGVSLVVLDDASSVGGTWANERLYPSLKSNNMKGTYEHPDFPMDEAVYGVKPYNHMPGTVMHKYLTDFAKKFGVFDKIRFNTKVESAERLGPNGWSVKTKAKEGQKGFTGTLKTKKLVIAIGNTSDPYRPTIHGEEDFGNPIIHMLELAKRTDLIESSKEVVIYGGGKSAWDGAYAFASKGVKVHMVMRETGKGPTWMAPPFVTPLKIWLEVLVSTRFLTWLSPNVFSYENGFSAIRDFFARWTIGRAFVKSFFGILADDLRTLNKYDSHPDTKLLKPWTNPFSVGAGLSILNQDTDFFELVREGKIKPHIGDITTLTEGTVNLSNGERLNADAFIFATGWNHKNSLNLSASGVPVGEFDLANHATSSDPADGQLAFNADEEVFRRLPLLKTVHIPDSATRAFRTVSVGPSPETRPTRNVQQLYRFIVPPSLLEDRTIAFAGKPLTFHTAFFSAIQGLWIASYLKGDLELPEQKDAKDEALLWARYQVWRNSSGHGTTVPELVFEAIPYLDILLQQMGLEHKRKPNFWQEWFAPYRISHYKGLVDEYKAKHG